MRKLYCFVRRVRSDKHRARADDCQEQQRIIDLYHLSVQGIVANDEQARSTSRLTSCSAAPSACQPASTGFEDERTSYIERMQTDTRTLPNAKTVKALDH